MTEDQNQYRASTDLLKDIKDLGYKEARLQGKNRLVAWNHQKSVLFVQRRIKKDQFWEYRVEVIPIGGSESLVITGQDLRKCLKAAIAVA